MSLERIVAILNEVDRLYSVQRKAQEDTAVIRMAVERGLIMPAELERATTEEKAANATWYDAFSKAKTEVAEVFQAAGTSAEVIKRWL